MSWMLNPILESASHRTQTSTTKAIFQKVRRLFWNTHTSSGVPCNQSCADHDHGPS